MMPPRVILAAIDFSEPSRAALVFAARMARHTGAALHVLHAEEPLLAEAAHQSGFELARETDEELGRLLAAAAPGATVSRHVVTGPAVDVILEVAARHGADLVVVGSHGMSGAERLVFGSTTEGVLRHAPMSVLVTPSVWSAGRAETLDLSGTGPVIAGVALAPPSLAAAHAACRLAVTIGTGVEMVHVVPDLPVLSRWRAHAETAVRDRVAVARTALDAVAREVACAAAVRTRVEVGAVPHRLAEAAAPSAERRPILVLGRLPVNQAAPGSIAYRVLMLAHVPVLMYVADR